MKNKSGALTYSSTLKKILGRSGKICLTRGILLVERTFSTDISALRWKKRSSYIFFKFKRMEQ